MKKIKANPHNAKRAKAIVAAAMALTLAIPTTAYFSSKSSKAEAEEAGPQAFDTFTFEKGFAGEKEAHGLTVVKSEDVVIFKEKMQGVNEKEFIYDGKSVVYDVTDKPFVEDDAYKYNVVGNQPVIGVDADMGNVLVFDDTVPIEEFKVKKLSENSKVDAANPIGTLLQEATIAESQVKAENPFKGKDLKDGAAISYWVKVPADTADKSKGLNSSLVVFGKKMENDRKVNTNKNHEAKAAEKEREAKLSIQISANNDFHYVNADASKSAVSTGDGSILGTPNEWAFVTVSMTDSEVVIYVNGEQKSNYSDAEQLGGLMAALADSDTGLFFGGNYSTAAEAVGQNIGTKRGLSYDENGREVSKGASLDDVSFYDQAITASEAAELYTNADKAKKTEVEPVVLEKFDFEDGMTGTVNGTVINGVEVEDNTAPEVVSDPVKGNVLKLSDGRSSRPAAGILSKNPFAGKDLTGATVNYWVRETYNDRTGSVNPTISLSFIDTPKPKNHDKIQGPLQGKESQTILYTKTDMDAKFSEGYTTQTYESLKNDFTFSTTKNTHVNNKTDSNGNIEDFLYDEDAVAKKKEYDERLANMTEWHMVTAVFTNAGIKMYYDGQPLSNNLAAPDDKYYRPNFANPRFYDGYYTMVYDGYAPFHRASNNQGATPLMTFLTDPTTSAYLGFMYKIADTSSYEMTWEAFYDDITYYGAALTDAQVERVWNGEPLVPTMPPTEPPTEEPEETPVPTAPASQDPGQDSTGTGTVQVGEDGKVNIGGAGIKLEAGADVFPENTILKFATLGKTASASEYEAFKSVFDKIQDFEVTDFTLYSITAEGAEVTPKGTFKLTFNVPEGYDTGALVVVDENGKEYAATLSADGKTITIEGVDHLGKFAVAVKNMSTDDESTVAPKNAYSGKTGDAANVVLPVIVLAVSAAAIIVVSKKKKTEEE